QIKQTSNLDPFVISSSTSPNYLVVKANGLVGVGSTTPIATLSVQGTSTLPATNIFVAASSTGVSALTVANNASISLSSLGIGLVRSTSGSLYTDSSTYLTAALTTISGMTGPLIHVATSSDTNILISINTTTAN